MAKKVSDAAKLSSTAGMATIVTGDATAIGGNTLTQVESTTSLNSNGNTTKAKGVITSVAAADPSADGTVFAAANTGVQVGGADKAVIRTKEITIENPDGTTVEVSITKFKAVDHLRIEGPGVVIETTTSLSHSNTGDAYAVELTGSTAQVSFDAVATGENTSVVVDADALVLQDGLSQSALTITSAVG